jgi:hypothetical protein
MTSPRAGQPAVDLSTDRVAVVMQDRPVVALTTWLADVIRGCAAGGRGLQLVTPVTSRLTTALYEALAGPETRWVVHSAGGHHDGHTGRALGWNGAAFMPLEPPAPAPAYTGGPPAPAWHHTVALEVRHQATEDLRLGGALERLALALTGHPPAGWGVAEPVTQPWDRAAFTDMCRDRAPQRTWLCVVGARERAAGALVDGPVLATTVVSRTPSGVLETVHCTAVHSQALHPGAFTGVLTALADAYDVRHALVQQHPGENDATRAAHRTGLTAPLAMLVGAEATSGRPRAELVGIGELAHERIGQSIRYELRAAGEAPAESWARFRRVMAHLCVPWPGAAGQPTPYSRTRAATSRTSSAPFSAASRITASVDGSSPRA